MLKMKFIYFLIMLSIPNIVSSQNKGAQFVTTVIIDSVNKKLKKSSGEQQDVTFSLVDKTVEESGNKSNDRYVVINISTVDVNVSGYSNGFVVTSNMDFALGRQDQTVLKRNSETIILRKSDLVLIKEFLNRTIVYQNENQNKDIGWSISLENSFTVSLVHDVKAKEWLYFLQLGQAIFSISIEEGKALMSKLVNYESQL